MTIPQTSVSDALPVAFPGMVADFNGILTETGVAEAEIGFGLAVSRGTAADGFKLPSAAGSLALGEFRGVAVATGFMQNVDNTLGFPAYNQYDSMVAAKRGVIWVVAEDDPGEGDDVFVRHTAGTGERAGAFRTDADGTDATQIAATLARWLAGGDSTLGLAPLELNMP